MTDTRGATTTTLAVRIPTTTRRTTPLFGETMTDQTLASVARVARRCTLLLALAVIAFTVYAIARYAGSHSTPPTKASSGPIAQSGSSTRGP